MNNENDVSVALEIIAIKISKNMFNTKELKKLLKEKDFILKGDRETIDKVINNYGNEIKEELKNVQN